MKTYKVIAKRTSYEYIEIKATNQSNVIEQITMGSEEFDWKDLPELSWDIDTIEEVLPCGQ
jgi:hypothetical protein